LARAPLSTGSRTASLLDSRKRTAWQTKWFLGCIGLVAVGVVVAVARYVTWKKVQRKLLKFEQQHAVEKERTRIAQDMHDDLGVRLTEILFMSNLIGASKPEDVPSHASRIESAARELVQNLDAIVWAVNPQNDSLKRAGLYIGEFTGRFLATTSIQCRLDIPTDLPDRPVSSETRHNLYLVIKEALHNIAKHSGASEVWLRLRLRETTLCISIEDNGRGFSTSDISIFGNGLGNMRKRVERVGGVFELVTEPGKGTRIELQIP